MKVPGIPPNYNDHFFGFSRWTKNCLPYKIDTEVCIWTWMDGDCIFQNDKTKDIHLIEFKCQDAHIKAYQARILRKLDELGIKIHVVRLQYDPMWFGNHEILGDPRFATKIKIDGKVTPYEQYLKHLLEWHGIDPDIDLKTVLHINAIPKVKVLQNEVIEI